ncbi:hypothetical protein [Pseudobutyrivibrio xylanivorans]|uniref:SGNH/GDSL hydrolase family protein n=1 Tax=Pseudobutyrivibrio xylanivorans TaxID=185007 RepID=A0A1G5RXP4_PSEXY|nr:hypothetical protein [Pseudobutyrivibrio xylanivorans]SCZ78628.1 hypothetical protein SAMN02910350_01367 [Pseudobutyrivibrio xylanivorans]
MKRFFTRGISVIAGTLIFVFICHQLNYIFCATDEWFQQLFRSYYKQDNIDNLFLGSSVVYFSENPEIMDEETGLNNFNLSSNAQRIDTSYFLLKDAIEKNDLKNVYIDCYSWIMTEYEIWDNEKQQYVMVDYIDDPYNDGQLWKLIDELKFSLTKAQIIAEYSKEGDVFGAVLPFTRYRQKLFDWDYIKENLALKTKTKKNNGEPEIHTDEYGFKCYIQEKGYQYIDTEIPEDGRALAKERDFNKYCMGKKGESWLRKCIELCQKNNINVTLYVTPNIELQIASTENYDRYYRELTAIADEYNVELYDFNLIKEDYLDLNDRSMFCDVHHMNAKGAEKFTKLLAKVLRSNPDKNKEMFYESIVQKKACEKPMLYGCYFYDYNEESGVESDPSEYDYRDFVIASNRENMKYTVSRTINGKNDGIPELIQESTDNKEIKIPINEHGIIYIDGEYENQHQIIEIDY